MNKPKVSAFLISYILMVSAGIFFVITPTAYLGDAGVSQLLTIVWGSFYIIGGMVGIAANVAGWFKKFRRRSLPLTLFEMGAIALIVAVNLIYGILLASAGISEDMENVTAAGLLILGLTAAYPYRALKMWELVKNNKLARRHSGGDISE